MKRACKLITLLIMVAGYAMNANADVRNEQIEVDGVRYRTDFYFYYSGYSAAPDWTNGTTLESDMKQLVSSTINLCQAELKAGAYHFYDGSEVPMFEYPAKIIIPNTPVNSNLPRYDAEKDTMAQRYPYYRGEVWFQDSVPMKALPDMRKTKNHIVCGIDDYAFNEELTFIRTPRYLIVRRGMFEYCIGLRTARIGAAQLVESKSFEDCYNLETVIFESAPYVRDYAFSNCRNIKKVVMEGKLPKPTADNISDYYPDYDKEDRNPFDKVVYEQATLYVHEDQMEAFRQDKTWGKFKNIRDIEEYLAGVEEINPDTETGYDVYDLSGLRVRTARSGENWREGLPAGVYIVKSTLGTVRKEHIK